MNIAEFARSRGVKDQTIRQYIYRHDEIKGLIDGGELSEEAEQELDKIYPLPAPVPVVHDRVAEQNYTRALEQITNLQGQLLAANKALGEASTAKLLAERSAEEAKDKADEADQRLGKAMNERDQARDQAEDERQARTAAEARAARLLDRGLLDRLFNRDV